MIQNRYQTTNNNLGSELKFIDIVVTIGVITSVLSLLINGQNNNVLDQINSNLKKINDSGGLDMIAQIGNNNNNIVEVNINEDE